MRYEYLPREDKIALEWYIDCLKEASNINIGYEIYEGSSWYIIYLDDNIFDELEDKIDEILDHNHKFLTIDKEILFAPKRFMVSYEKKIENCPDFIQHHIDTESDLHPMVAQMTTMAKLPPLDLPPVSFEEFDVKVK